MQTVGICRKWETCTILDLLPYGYERKFLYISSSNLCQSGTLNLVNQVDFAVDKSVKSEFPNSINF